MKPIRDIALIVTLALTMPVLGGCAVREWEERHDMTAAKAYEQSSVLQAEAPLPEEDSSRPVSPLTQEEIAAIALQDAGLTAQDVSKLRSESDTDEKIPHYDVEFRKDNVEYEYEIHAETGEILKSEKDVEKEKTADPTKPEEKPAAQPTAKPESSVTKLLTKEEAEAAALKHAGLTQADVTKLRTEYDFDDGIPTYEVDFRQGHTEYDYEIHAETGEILQAEKETDD